MFYDDRLTAMYISTPVAPRYPWPKRADKHIKQLEDENLRLRTQAEETEVQADHISASCNVLETALWDVYVAIGCDTDGDTDPSALIRGMGLEGFARMVVNEVKNYRAEEA